MRAFTTRTAVALIGAATLATACADSPTAPALDAAPDAPLAARIAYIDITPDSASVAVGDTTRLRAIVYDVAGRPIASEQVFWLTSDNAVATVQDGLVKGVSTGRTTIGAYARRGYVSVPVTVTAAAPPAPTPAPAPAGIFSQGFEAGLGTWDDRGESTRQRVVIDPARARSGSGVLEVTYPQGGGGGWLTKFLQPGYDSVTVSYWVRFDPSWQGGTYLLGLRGSRSDNLWSGFGKAGQCPDGTDYFNASLFVDYNGNPGDTRFYSYYPGMSTPGCYGDTGAGRATYVAPLTMTRGAWHRVDFSVKLNRIGHADGVQRLYIDGVLRGEWRNMTFRTSSNLTLNSITLDFGSQGAPQAQHLWVDDISVVAGNATTEAPSPTPAPAPVAAVAVTPTAPTLTVGQGTQLQATLRDASGNVLTGRAVTWSSSNAGVASVSASGYVTALAAGSATVTATSEGRSGSTSVTVNAPAPVAVASVTVAPSSLSLTTTQAAQLSATVRDGSGNTLTGRAVTWSTSNPLVATVSAAGQVTAVAAGSATVSATSEGRTGSASVSVTAPPVLGGAPSLWSKDFEDGSWSMLNAPNGAPSGPHALVTDATNCSGQRCYRYTIPSGTQFASNDFYINGGSAYDEIWWSVDFKITDVIRGQLKGLRYTGSGSDLGGSYFMGRSGDGSSGIGFAFGSEASGVQLAIGAWFGPRSSGFASAGGLTYLENATSSGYHRLTMHYQRNGNSVPRVRFWIDGKPVVQPQGAAYAIDGYTWGQSQGGANWVNGAAGEPSWLVPASRATSQKLTGLRMFDQMSSSGNSGYIYVDNMRVSTTPIAP